MYKILFIQPSQRPYYKEPEYNVFYHMSEYFSGDAISSLTGRHVGQMDDITEINANLPTFTYHLRNRSRLPRVLGIISENIYYLKKGLSLCRTTQYDAIVAHPTSLTGVVGLIIKVFTGIKLVVEVPTHPTLFFTEAHETPLFLDKCKAFAVKRLFNFICNRADMVKLMYPGQVDDFPGFNPHKMQMFFDFTPINTLIPLSVEQHENYILLVGTPSYLKGVDILIKAFNIVAEQHPQYRLKIVGHCSNKDVMRQLSHYNERIDFYDQLPCRETAQLMMKCTILTLPSRTEGIPRVIQEAMALGRPVIASNVGGIPQIITNNVNGILVEKEDIFGLATSIDNLLTNRSLAESLATSAIQHARTYYTETAFVTNYKNMIEQTLT